MTMPLSRTRSRTSIRLVPPAARSTATAPSYGRDDRRRQLGKGSVSGSIVGLAAFICKATSGADQTNRRLSSTVRTRTRTNRLLRDNQALPKERRDALHGTRPGSDRVPRRLWWLRLPHGDSAELTTTGRATSPAFPFSDWHGRRVDAARSTPVGGCICLGAVPRRVVAHTRSHRRIRPIRVAEVDPGRQTPSDGKQARVLSAVCGRDHGWGNTASRHTADCRGELVVVERHCAAFATGISQGGGCCVRTYHPGPAANRQQTRFLRLGIGSRCKNQNRRSRQISALRVTAIADCLNRRRFRRWYQVG